MKRRTKWILVAVAGLVVVGASAAIAMSGGEDIVAVRIETAQNRDLVSTVTASGWIRPRTAVEVQADIMGRITELHVAEGDLVQRGQTLMRIDPSQYEAGVARARAGVSEALAAEAQARANLVQARATLERAEGLAASDARLISGRELDEARTQVRVQEALHQAARFRVEQSQAALRETQD
ncbi:MAG: efflux RND transporter periplasmic adaptor subunit, partial [Longimicrobiales bacterium]